MPMRLVTTVNFGRLHIFDSRERSTTRSRSCASIATMDPSCLVLRIALRQDRTTDPESVALARKPILPTRATSLRPSSDSLTLLGSISAFASFLL